METKLRLPVVGEYLRSTGRIIAIEQITPPPPPPVTEYIAEEITASIELWRGAHRLSTHGTFWDAYGRFSSITCAICDAAALAAKMAITATSEVELRVMMHIEWIRKQPDGSENFYAKGTADFARGARRDDLPDPECVIVWNTREVFETPERAIAESLQRAEAACTAYQSRHQPKPQP